ncbi:MAG: hypothetical protein ABIG44_16795 [Planctomycetota bacterium]
MVGNNIYVSGPRRPDNPPPAVFEYDPNKLDQGLTRRLPTHNSDQLSAALWCTNPMRLRRSPVECRRYMLLERQLTELEQSGRQLDVDRALKLIHRVRQRTTLHSVVFLPARRIMHVHIPAFGDEVVEFRLDEWQTRPTAHTLESKQKDKP